MYLKAVPLCSDIISYISNLLQISLQNYICRVENGYTKPTPYFIERKYKFEAEKGIVYIRYNSYMSIFSIQQIGYVRDNEKVY